MKTIIHISNDYPDVMAPRKTNAVRALVEGTPEYRHVVYSLNRVNALSGLASMSFGNDRVSVAYGALPKGLFWRKRLAEVGQWILNDIKSKGISPDLIEAHKYTIEGFIGLDLARAFDVPLICDVQGYTDVNILQKKVSWRSEYRKIGAYCSAVFPYAPWVIDYFVEAVGLDAKKCVALPVVPGMDTMAHAPIIGENKLLSVFHLDGWKNKNFEGMALAVKALLPKNPDLVLDVYGGGSARSVLDLNNIIKAHNLGENVRLMGPVDNGDMRAVMQKYSGFVMPSKSESYGLVYVEALFSGLPIIFNKNRGIAGYFDANDIGYGANASDVNDIAHGIEYLLSNEASLKEKVASMQDKGAFDKLRKDQILDSYRSVINRILNNK